MKRAPLPLLGLLPLLACAPSDDPGWDHVGHRNTNTAVYLDAQNFGVRDENEPAVETQADGSYTIDNLGPSVVAVSTLLDETTLHASPLGSDFEQGQVPLFGNDWGWGRIESLH